jgi:hypothetical protein
LSHRLQLEDLVSFLKPACAMRVSFLSINNMDIVPLVFVTWCPGLHEDIVKRCWSRCQTRDSELSVPLEVFDSTSLLLLLLLLQTPCLSPGPGGFLLARWVSVSTCPSPPLQPFPNPVDAVGNDGLVPRLNREGVPDVNINVESLADPHVSLVTSSH